MAQHPQPLLCVALDLEMTGTNADKDAIIEIGAVRFTGEALDGDEFHSFVRPPKSIPYNIRRLTGIRDDMLRGAPERDEALGLLEHYIGDAPLVGHNIGVDLRFLHAAGLKLRNPLFDTYDLVVTLFPELQTYTLAALASHLGVATTHHHRALDDAHTTRRVFLKLLAHLRSLDAQTREELRRLPVSGSWTVGALLDALPSGAAGATTSSSTGLGGHGTDLRDRLAEQHDVSPRVFQLGGLGQQLPPPFQTSAEMLAVATQAQAMVRPAVAQQAQGFLSEGGARLLDLDLDRVDLISLLAPAARWAVATNSRVVISAPDAATMSRVAREIAPQAFAAAGVSRTQYSVAELGERESYLCVRRWLGGATVADGAEVATGVTRELGGLTNWSKRTQRGSRAELSSPLREGSAWERSRAGVELRDSAMDCPYGAAGYCFLSSAQNAANAAWIVVTTHNALAAALLGRDNLLPPTTRVIALDPAALEDALREARTHALRPTFVTALLSDLSMMTEQGQRVGLLHWAWQAYCPTDPVRGQAWADEVSKAMVLADDYFAALHIVGQMIAPKSDDHRVTIDDGVRRSQAWRQAYGAWGNFRSALDGVINLLRAIANEAETQAPRATSDVACAMVELLFSARQLEAIRDAGDELMEPATPHLVTWIERRKTPEEVDGESGRHIATPRGLRTSGGPVKSDTDLFGVYPLYGDAVRPLVANGNGLLLAGPGLAAGGDFDMSRTMFGLPHETRAANYSRDRAEQTLLCLPTDVPEPNMPHYQERLNQTLIRLATELDGRLVVFFASRGALNAGAQGIRHALEQRGILTLAQGIDGSSGVLWRRFNAEPRAVLLGGSFWKHMPEQTRRSYCIVIPRLPTPAESDAVVVARGEQWDDPYEGYSIPTAAQRMRIALARLAWSHEERNAIVLFDRRALVRSYGHAALATLPRCQELRAPVDEITREVSYWIGPA